MTIDHDDRATGEHLQPIKPIAPTRRGQSPLRPAPPQTTDKTNDDAADQDQQHEGK
ncbi:hypothetical protein [Bradyrhizobium sp. LCT2]|uniref:hypothetical protein n=1 Tax=Bradyrhizobium sp. LCT2 TaxID=2493093 RepID=UPI001374D9C2|nr:hypothetical protein [Bradyrhizobium sp. LCT2]